MTVVSVDAFRVAAREFLEANASRRRGRGDGDEDGLGLFGEGDHWPMVAAARDLS